MGAAACRLCDLPLAMGAAESTRSLAAESVRIATTERDQKLLQLLEQFEDLEPTSAAEVLELVNWDVAAVFRELVSQCFANAALSRIGRAEAGAADRGPRAMEVDGVREQVASDAQIAQLLSTAEGHESDAQIARLLATCPDTPLPGARAGPESDDARLARRLAAVDREDVRPASL